MQQDRDVAGQKHAVHRPRLVGRRAELRRLTEALAHPPASVLVEGEAGIGKSRLLREGLAALAGRLGQPLVAACPPFHEGLTLGSVVDALRQACDGVAGLGLSPLAGSLRPLFPEWSPDLPPAPERLDDAGAARHRLFRALAEVLDTLGTRVLAVEDVHWADEATLGFLLFLSTRQPRRVSLVLTYRPEEVPAGSLLLRLSSRLAPGPGNARVELGPLTVRDTAGLVSSMLGDGHVSDAFARFLHARTEGLPLAVEESVRLLDDRADVRYVDGEWVRRTLDEITVPPTIRDAVLERVERLGPDTRAVLRAAAVLNEPTHTDAVTRVCGLPSDRARQAVRAALRSGILDEDARGRIGFRHVLAARAVYGDVAGVDLRRLHLRAGRALEGVRPLSAARLARHFREAGDDDAWCRYTEQAADLALASGDQQTAVPLLHELLAEGALPAQAVARLARKFPVFAFTGYFASGELVRTLRRVLDGPLLSGPERGEVRSQLGRMLLQAGHYGAGAAELERALPDLADRPLDAAWAMSHLGRPVGTSWPLAAHRRWLDRSEALVKAVVPEDQAFPFLVARATALLEMGDPEGWEVAAALAPSGTGPDESVQVTLAALNIGDGAMQWGRYGEARRRLTEACALAEEHRWPRLGDMAATTLVHLDWFTGRWTGLQERAAALALLGEEPMILLDTSVVRGLLAAARGAFAEAEALFTHVLREGERRRITCLPLEPAAALARMRLAQGRAADALAVTDEPVRVLMHKGVWLWGADVLPARVGALAAAGRAAEARELTAGFAEGLGTTDAPALRAALACCRAVVAGESGPDAAAGAWESAAALWELLPCPYAALLARERQGDALVAAGRRDDARGLLRGVRQGLSELGASHDADRLDRTLAGLGPVGRGPGRGYGDALSPREWEVVRLMLTGLSNPEIARALSRSPKTVAAQLNSAMRKHGVSSRTALAVAAIRAGMTPADAPDAAAAD